MSKLYHYSIRGNANKIVCLFFNYCNRQRYVFSSQTQSNCRPIKYGVLQSFVPGPLLFALYLNDIHSASYSAPRLNPDDTCLILQHDNISSLKAIVKQEICAVNKWMVANKSTFNMSKSNLF